MQADTTTATTWSGWWRRSRHERWTRFVTGHDSYDAAWGALLDKLRADNLRNGESLVVEGNRDPNAPVVKRRRCF